MTETSGQPNTGGAPMSGVPITTITFTENNGSTASTDTSVTSGNKPARDALGRLLPGNTANPGGRPSVSITTEIKKALMEVLEDPEIPNEEKKTGIQLIIRKIMKNAIVKEDEKMLTKIWSYIDGLPKGSLDVGVDREGLAELTEFMKALANPKKPSE